MMVNDFSFGEVQWVAYVQSVLCEGWCCYIIIFHQLMLCQSMSEGSASLYNVYLGASTTRYRVHNPLLLIQWYCFLGVYQHVAKCAQWTKDHLDVQPCEDLSHSHREAIDVGPAGLTAGWGEQSTLCVAAVHSRCQWEHQVGVQDVWHEGHLKVWTVTLCSVLTKVNDALPMEKWLCTRSLQLWQELHRWDLEKGVPRGLQERGTGAVCSSMLERTSTPSKWRRPQWLPNWTSLDVMDQQATVIVSEWCNM